MGDPTGPSEERVVYFPFGPTAKEAVARRHGARAAAEIEKLWSELVDEDEGWVQRERFALCALPGHDGIPGLLNRWSDATLDAVLAVPDAEALLTLVGRRQTRLAYSSTPQARLLLRHVNETLLPNHDAAELMPELVADTSDPPGRAFLVALLARLGVHVPMLLAGTDRCVVWFPKGAYEWLPNLPPKPALLKPMVAAIASLQLVILPKSTTVSGFLGYTIVTADAAMLVHVEVHPGGLVHGLLPSACCEALMLFAAAVEDGARVPELLGLVDAGAANAALRAWGGGRWCSGSSRSTRPTTPRPAAAPQAEGRRRRSRWRQWGPRRRQPGRRAPGPWTRTRPSGCARRRSCCSQTRRSWWRRRRRSSG